MSTSTESEEIRVNKWDLNAIKNAIDDAVKQSANDVYGFVESHKLLHYRLIISTVSVAVAGVALLWDWLHPFPTSRPVIIACVCTYFLLMGVLQMYAWYVEKGIFYSAIARDANGKVADRHWAFSGNMKKYDHVYTLDVELCVSSDDVRSATLSKSVAQWVDDEGSLLLNVIKTDVKRLCESLGDDKKDK